MVFLTELVHVFLCRCTTSNFFLFTSFLPHYLFLCSDVLVFWQLETETNSAVCALENKTKVNKNNSVALDVGIW